MPREIMIIIIVAIIASAYIIKAGLRHSKPLPLPPLGGADEGSRVENQRLRAEVEDLKERLHVLERITTDKENTLSREIENLRDR